MKLKKITAILLVISSLFLLLPFSSSAEDEDVLPECFEFGIGPETEGFSIDYRYYSPVKENDSNKYPLVIWLHGLGDGQYDGKQVVSGDIDKWATGDFQSRFKDSDGAFIFVPRSVEEQELYWEDELVYPLRAAIDDFIEKNKDNIDPQRIYMGGYSMGGKMTLKMAVAYPDMFAAIFPICPAWIPGAEAVAKLKDMPVWLVSGARDILVNYYMYVTPTWDNIISQSNVPESCRLSTLVFTLYPDGMPASSSHFAWFSVSNDMFSDKNGAYPMMKTKNGLGENVSLTYPDGMISWMSGFRSNFDASEATDLENSELLKTDGRPKGLNLIWVYLKNYISYIGYLLGIV